MLIIGRPSVECAELKCSARLAISTSDAKQESGDGRGRLFNGESDV